LAGKRPYQHRNGCALKGFPAMLKDLMLIGAESMGVEIKHRQYDQDGDELRQDSNPHQTVRPIAGGFAANPQRIEAGQQDEGDYRDRHGHKKFTRHGPVLRIGAALDRL
jgi:hypothetical protein